jgi:hypothetical protein
MMKTYGWFYLERSPKRRKKYIYARRRQGLKMVERYICPLSQLPNLTEQELVEKLVQKPTPKS